MAEKVIKTRLQLKHDTTANWNSATNFIPKSGEPIIYTDGLSTIPLIKIGDGKTKVSSLPFVGASRVANNLTIKLNNGSTENTNLFTFNGSAGKIINITPSSIGALPLSGGELTGNLKGKHVIATWFQTTAATNLGKAPTAIPVLDASGWFYKRTPSELLSDIGAAASNHSHSNYASTSHNHDTVYLKKSGELIQDTAIDTHAESRTTQIGYFMNDLTCLKLRGGSCVATISGSKNETIAIGTTDYWFDGTTTYGGFSVGATTDTVTIIIKSFQNYHWSNRFGIGFGSDYWRAKNIKWELGYATTIGGDPASDAWVTIGNITNNAKSIVTFSGAGPSTGNASSKPWNTIRITLTNFNNTSPRIAGIWSINCGSSTLAESLFPRRGGTVYGGINTYGNITPQNNKAYSLGTNAKYWNNIYGTNIYENGTALSSKYAAKSHTHDYAASNHNHTVNVNKYTANTTNIKATASGTAVGANGTATVLTGVKATATANVVSSITPTTAAVVSGVGANGTAAAITKVTTATTTVAKTGFVASYDATTKTLTLSQPSTATVVTGVTPTTTNVLTGVKATATKTVVTGITNETKAVVTGVGANGTSTVLTGVKVTAQPTIALATGATAGTGVISVATGITGGTEAKSTN